MPLVSLYTITKSQCMVCIYEAMLYHTGKKKTGRVKWEGQHNFQTSPPQYIAFSICDNLPLILFQNNVHVTPPPNNFTFLMECTLIHTVKTKVTL